jgi:hypothetical protein
MRSLILRLILNRSRLVYNIYNGIVQVLTDSIDVYRLNGRFILLSLILNL